MSGILFLRSAKDDEEPDAYICAAQKEGFEAENVGVLSSVFVNEDALSLLLEQSLQKGVVATSARAVNALRRVWDGVSADAKACWKKRPFFTIGPSAISNIEQMGFTPSGSESGNASNLATFIIDNLNSSGPLLFLSGDKSLNILQERLKEAGISLDSIMVYTTGANLQFRCQYEAAAPINTTPNPRPLVPLTPSSALDISVSDPQKHGEGTSAFVNYLVTTKTSLEAFSSPVVSVRRRFQDFAWLHKALSDEYPYVILAALPGKHRLEYITGDRFSPEFIEKRKVSLDNYLKRVSRHPLIAKSQILRRFLESNEIVPEFVAKAAQAHVLDNISDVLLNAFSKIKHPDPKYIEFKEHVDKFQETLISLERLHARLIRSETELELDMLEFGGCITTLGLMETQITSPLTDFGTILRNLCTLMRERINHEDLVYLTNIQEYIGHCMSAKETLKTRDQKQTDVEELSVYLQNHITDREKALNPQRGGGGIASFLSTKMQELQGVDTERARQTKIIKLSGKITELQEAVQASEEMSIAFNKELEREIDFYERIKLDDLKTDLKAYVDNQVLFYEKSLEYWDQIVPIIENIQLEDQIE
ncbi:intercellular trafficking and secretion [Chytriomyces hyalinus]|nr:intercellular trafficking and secretion [Chytriomyces hyalinus]